MDCKKEKETKKRKKKQAEECGKREKGSSVFLGCGRRSLWLNRFGHARSERRRDGGRTRTRTRTRETANAKGVRGMDMGNGLLSSFGAWPGPKRPVKVIGKVTEIVAHSTLGAGQ